MARTTQEIPGRVDEVMGLGQARLIEIADGRIVTTDARRTVYNVFLDPVGAYQDIVITEINGFNVIVIAAG